MRLPDRIRLLGDRLVVVDLGDVMDVAVNARVHTCARLVEAAALPGVREVVPAIASFGIHVDPGRIALPDLVDLVRRVLARAEAQPPEHGDALPTVTIPVRYGGAFGPDLAAVAAWAGLSESEVCERHASSSYRVFMLGFSPGFAYLGLVDPAIAVPRLESPRLRVPAGSVGIAGSQTGVYPRTGPGGWRIIGRTPVRLFDPSAMPPARLRPGQPVQFVAIHDDAALEAAQA
jgi:KipI family sensor histidine kinase inhibitor